MSSQESTPPPSPQRNESSQGSVEVVDVSSSQVSSPGECSWERHSRLEKEQERRDFFGKLNKRKQKALNQARASARRMESIGEVAAQEERGDVVGEEEEPALSQESNDCDREAAPPPKRKQPSKRSKSNGPSKRSKTKQPSKRSKQSDCEVAAQEELDNDVSDEEEPALSQESLDDSEQEAAPPPNRKQPSKRSKSNGPSKRSKTKQPSKANLEEFPIAITLPTFPKAIKEPKTFGPDFDTKYTAKQCTLTLMKKVKQDFRTLWCKQLAQTELYHETAAKLLEKGSTTVSLYKQRQAECNRVLNENRKLMGEIGSLKGELRTTKLASTAMKEDVKKAKSRAHAAEKKLASMNQKFIEASGDKAKLAVLQAELKRRDTVQFQSQKAQDNKDAMYARANAKMLTEDHKTDAKHKTKNERASHVSEMWMMDSASTNKCPPAGTAMAMHNGQFQLTAPSQQAMAGFQQPQMFQQQQPSQFSMYHTHQQSQQQQMPMQQQQMPMQQQQTPMMQQMQQMQMQMMQQMQQMQQMQPQMQMQMQPSQLTQSAQTQSPMTAIGQVPMQPPNQHHGTTEMGESNTEEEAAASILGMFATGTN